VDLFRKDLILRIEGIPTSGTDETQWDINYRSGLLTEIPASLDASVDLQTGEFDLGAVSFATSAKPWANRMLLADWRAQGTAASLVDSGGISDVDNQWTVDSPTQSIAAGDVLWMGNETIKVDSIVSSSGTEYTLSVTRGVAGSTGEPHSEGRAVYLDGPPSMALRKVELVEKHVDTGAETIVWRGLLRGVSTDAQQTEIQLDCAELLSVLWGSKGGVKNPLSDFDLRIRPNGTLFGSCAYEDGWEPPGDTPTSVHVRLNDSVYQGSLANQSGRITFQGQSSRWNTEALGEAGDVLAIEDAHVVLNKADFEGAYGVTVGSDGVYHPVSLALALLLSTGDGSNNLEDPDSGATRTFDILNRSWGLGIPASLIDAESWLRIIDEQPALSVDRVPLAFEDATFEFKRTVLGRLLAPLELIPVVDNDGLLALRELESFDVQTPTSAVTLNPTRIRLDRRLRDRSGKVKGTVAGSFPDEDPDTVIKIGFDGFRADTRANQTPTAIDFAFYDKPSAESRGAFFDTYIESRLERARDNPPVLACEVPKASGNQALPSLLQWVELRGGPETGVIGPDGERGSMSSLGFKAVGLLVGRTLDFKTGDVECRVLLSNWHLSNQPRLIAPTARLESSGGTTNTHSVSSSDEYLAADGKIGLSSGDNVRLVNQHGRPHVADPGGLTVSGVNEGAGTLVFSSSFDVPSSGECYAVLADYDDYTPDPRLWAYLADAAGELGATNDSGDIYLP
jgi:hypothetical protein